QVPPLETLLSLPLTRMSAYHSALSHILSLCPRPDPSPWALFIQDSLKRPATHPIPFDQCYNHPRFYSVLYHFFEKRLCAESLNFMRAVEDYEKLFFTETEEQAFSKERKANLAGKRADTAQRVMKTYIRDDASEQVNIDDKTRNILLERDKRKD